MSHNDNLEIPGIQRAKLISRLKKILELARRGQGGEKENAQRMLQRQLDKYGITLADLDDQPSTPRTTYWFKYASTLEKRLLGQIIHSTHLPGHDRSLWRSKSRRNSIGIDLTKGEHIEVSLAYEAHREGLKKQLKAHELKVYRAYVAANSIYPEREDDDAERPPLTPEQLKELREIMAMAEGIDPTPVHQQIEVRN